MPTIRLIRGSSAALVTAGSSPGSSALNAAAAALSAEYDNSSNLHMFADFEITCTFGVSPTFGDQTVLYLIPCNDGTNYTDGDGTIVPGTNLVVGWFANRNTTSAQRLTARGPVGQRIEIPPCKFKVVVKNNTGQNISAGWAVTMFPYSLQS